MGDEARLAIQDAGDLPKFAAELVGMNDALERPRGGGCGT